MEVKHFEPNLALFSVVQILSQNGLKKTLKKLRKETNCKKLKEKFIPEELRSLNFEKIIYKKIKKKINNKSKDKKGRKDKGDKDKRNGDKLVYNKFVKSNTLLANDYSNNDNEYSNNTDVKDSKGLNDNNNKAINNGLEKDKLQKINNLDKDNLDSFKGKDFRNQKNKKKRSSWKGSGQINECVNSFIFTDSDS